MTKAKPFGRILTKNVKNLEKLLRWNNIYKKSARQQLHSQQQRSKLRFDTHRKDHQFQINDLVWWKVPGGGGKFRERFSGPFLVIKEQHPSYTIQDPQTKTVKHIHISSLKLVYPRSVSSV